MGHANFVARRTGGKRGKKGMNFALFQTVLSFLSRLFSTLFGIIVPLISILLFITTGFDFMYLLITPMQQMMDKLLDGKRLGGFRLVSNDAIISLEQSHVTGKNCMILYLKKRSKTYIVVVVLMYLVVGGLPKALSFILSYVISMLKNWGLTL